MNQHLHAVAGYMNLHRNDSEGLLLLLQRQLLPGSPEYDAVVELLSEMARVKEEARLAAEAQEKKARREDEERRFQIQLSEVRKQGDRAQAQLDESKIHGWWTRRIAGLALLASAVSVGVAILALFKQPPKPSPQAPATLSSVPAASVPQTINSVPTNTPPVAQTNQVRP
jgi:hypothetical protein